MCSRIVETLDSDVLVAGAGGRIQFANVRARETAGEALDDVPVDQVFTLPGGQTRAMLSRVAGANDWVPLNLTLARGELSGMEVKFRARGVRAPDGRGRDVLLIADRKRDDGFAQLRGLVRQLNTELHERRTLQGQLEKALASEKRLHGELVHRVKNNLALLNALIHFRQRATNNVEVAEALNDLEHRVHAILAVHELLDRAGEVDFVQASDLIRALCKQLKNSLLPDNIEIENDLLDVILKVEDATPLSLLVNELIINAVKHGYADGDRGVVKVGLKKNGVDKLEVFINDDGRGMAEEPDHVGSGSRIMAALAKQLGGTLERRQVARGTAVSFVFPYDEGDARQADHRQVPVRPAGQGMTSE